MYVCVCACVRACVCACVCVDTRANAAVSLFVCVCLFVRACVFNIAVRYVVHAYVRACVWVSMWSCGPTLIRMWSCMQNMYSWVIFYPVSIYVCVRVRVQPVSIRNVPVLLTGGKLGQPRDIITLNPQLAVKVEKSKIDSHRMKLGQRIGAGKPFMPTSSLQSL